MIDLGVAVVAAAWHVLTASAPFMLLGLTMAGLLKAGIQDDFVASHLGRRGVRSVVIAALIGAPIPL